tara:strand:+ start:2993 stop:3097 length:105 start_codon:yes stop_codon:yes gene_type:complete
MLVKYNKIVEEIVGIKHKNNFSDFYYSNFAIVFD